MWTASLSWKHDCIIGNRCKKYKVIAKGIPIEFFEEKGKLYYSHVQTIHGDKLNIDKFLKDLKKDSRIKEFEVEGNFVFFSYSVKSPKGVPTTHSYNRLFFFKPVIVNKEGYEFWEITSWSRDAINNFIKNTRPTVDEFKIISIKKSKLNEIYFPKLLPNITDYQKQALNLAVENGYYEFPRKIKLEGLSKKMNLKLSAYREHLRKAEGKVLSELI